MGNTQSKMSPNDNSKCRFCNESGCIGDECLYALLGYKYAKQIRNTNFDISKLRNCFMICSSDNKLICLKDCLVSAKKHK